MADPVTLGAIGLAVAKAAAISAGTAAGAQIAAEVIPPAAKSIGTGTRKFGRYLSGGYLWNDIKHGMSNMKYKTQRGFYSMIGNNEKVAALDKKIRINEKDKEFKNSIKDLAYEYGGNTPEAQYTIKKVTNFTDQLVKAKEMLEEEGITSPTFQDFAKKINWVDGTDSIKSIIGMIAPGSEWSPAKSQTISYFTELAGINSPAALIAISLGELYMLVKPVRKIVNKLLSTLLKPVKWLFGINDPPNHEEELMEILKEFKKRESIPEPPSNKKEVERYRKLFKDYATGEPLTAEDFAKQIIDENEKYLYGEDEEEEPKTSMATMATQPDPPPGGRALLPVPLINKSTGKTKEEVDDYYSDDEEPPPKKKSEEAPPKRIETTVQVEPTPVTTEPALPKTPSNIPRPDVVERPNAPPAGKTPMDEFNEWTKQKEKERAEERKGKRGRPPHDRAFYKEYQRRYLEAVEKMPPEPEESEDDDANPRIMTDEEIEEAHAKWLVKRKDAWDKHEKDGTKVPAKYYKDPEVHLQNLRLANAIAINNKEQEEKAKEKRLKDKAKRAKEKREEWEKRREEVFAKYPEFRIKPDPGAPVQATDKNIEKVANTPQQAKDVVTPK